MKQLKKDIDKLIKNYISANNVSKERHEVIYNLILKELQKKTLEQIIENNANRIIEACKNNGQFRFLDILDDIMREEDIKEEEFDSFAMKVFDYFESKNIDLF